jgi:hypothetical protein
MQRALRIHSILICGNVCVEYPLRSNHVSLFVLCLQDVCARVLERWRIMRRGHSFTGHVVVKLCLGGLGEFNFGHCSSEEAVSGQNSSRPDEHMGMMKDGIHRPQAFALNDGNGVEINV